MLGQSARNKASTDSTGAEHASFIHGFFSASPATEIVRRALRQLPTHNTRWGQPRSYSVFAMSHRAIFTRYRAVCINMNRLVAPWNPTYHLGWRRGGLSGYGPVPIDKCGQLLSDKRRIVCRQLWRWRRWRRLRLRNNVYISRKHSALRSGAKNSLMHGCGR